MSKTVVKKNVDPSTIYTLLEKMGSGSYGSVWKAQEIKTKLLVAVKIVNIKQHEEGLDEVLKEVHFLQGCDHPNIIKYYDCYQKNDDLWVCPQPPTALPTIDYHGICCRRLPGRHYRDY